VIKLTNALGAEKILPITMAFKRVPLEIIVPSQPLYGLDGEVRTGKSTLRPGSSSWRVVSTTPIKAGLSVSLTVSCLF